MPPGSVVYMNEKSAYINTDLMYTWLKTHFVPRKPDGTVVLILDGHASHCNSVEMLEYAEEHGVILLCLPSHTTQFLQPLDRCFFKSLKAHFNTACNSFVRANPTRKINRLQFGGLLSDAWTKSATVENAVSAFRATGICPFNPGAIPEYAFLCAEENEPPNNIEAVNTDGSQSSDNDQNEIIPGVETNEIATPSKTTKDAEPLIDEEIEELDDDTPGTMLNKIQPVPNTSAQVEKNRKRAKQVALVLTSPDNIEKRKAIAAKNDNKKNPKHKEKDTLKRKKISTVKKPRSKKQKSLSDSSTDEDVTDFHLEDSGDSPLEEEEAECLGCGEPYSSTSKKEDWIECLHCKKWFHESCSNFVNICNGCSKILNKKAVKI